VEVEMEVKADVRLKWKCQSRWSEGVPEVEVEVEVEMEVKGDGRWRWK
jgi:hypothetical protein